MDIHDRIKLILAENPEMTPRSVSLAAGLSDSMLYKFFNPEKRGGIRSITLETVDKLAEALNVNPRWLAYGDGPKEPDSKIIYIWDRIPERRREQAAAILETFTDGAPQPSWRNTPGNKKA